MKAMNIKVKNLLMGVLSIVCLNAFADHHGGSEVSGRTEDNRSQSIKSLEIELEPARAEKETARDTDKAARQLREQLEAAMREIESLKERNRALLQKAEENNYLHDESADLRREVVWLRSLLDKSRSELDQAESGLVGILQEVTELQQALNGARHNLSMDMDAMPSPGKEHYSASTKRSGRDLQKLRKEEDIPNSVNRRQR